MVCTGVVGSLEWVVGCGRDDVRPRQRRLVVPTPEGLGEDGDDLPVVELQPGAVSGTTFNFRCTRRERDCSAR